MVLGTTDDRFLSRVLRRGNRLLGRTAGFLLVGGFMGWVWSPFGFAVGYVVDRWRRLADFRPERWPRLANDPVEQAAAVAVCALMGHVAKADGRVSKAEIAVAERVFDALELSTEARRTAIRLFSHGKEPDFPGKGVARRLRKCIGGDQELVARILEYLVAVAVADGALHDPAERVLSRIARGLGRPAEALDQPLRKALFGGGLALHELPRSPYRQLGIEPSASDVEVTRAYRRLVSRHHPDRLQARGLPVSEVRAGADRVMAARRAVEAIRRQRTNV